MSKRNKVLTTMEIVPRVVAVLIVASAGNLFAQATRPNSLAALVLSETGALDSTPSLATWRKLNPGERLKNPAYDNEYETQGLWCAASVADFTFPGGLTATRQAFFHPVPSKPADPLPAHPDAGLLQQCRLLALWYEVENPVEGGPLAKSLSADLAASLGPPEQPSRFKRGDGDWGSGNWDPYFAWQRPNARLVLAVDPEQAKPGPSAHTRLLIIARSSLAPRGLSFDWSGQPPKGQPSLKGAAESARIARVENPCSFDDGQNNWEGGLIAFGEKLLRDLPGSPWRPYVDLTLARTYAARLILTYPGVELNGARRPTDPDALRRGAIVHFRAFLAANRESPEAGSAWHEAWRLLAGLPPSPIHFACTD
ncbi:MAG: hypothetical protein M3N54_06305 [Acidobacteriota bacterium]|nr:hypothetical protein [Acidobacteriota bacterium]